MFGATLGAGLESLLHDERCVHCGDAYKSNCMVLGTFRDPCARLAPRSSLAGGTVFMGHGNGNGYSLSINGRTQAVQWG